VVAARLADARFFFGEDRKVALDRRAEDLRSLTFHAKLGSYADKASRVAALGTAICEALGWQGEKEHVAQAARLSKADLTASMVKEFTSLQGTMGGIYARLEGAPDAVWQAIYDQYLPAAPTDPLPRGRTGEVLAVADRMDSLVGLFGLGLVPTGSKDPFGLRRAALGVARILMEREWRCTLDWLVSAAAAGYAERPPETRQVPAFFADRLRYLLALEGFSHDEIDAGLGDGAGLDFAALRARVAALHGAREEPGFRSVVLAAKRIENILREERGGQLDGELLREPAERALHAAHQAFERKAEAVAETRDYRGLFAAVEELAPVLDRFFVEIMVMDPDPRLRANRLALLGALRRTLALGGKLHELTVEKAR
jgi:glycyl-tRNA synthetase beta chain